MRALVPLLLLSAAGAGVVRLGGAELPVAIVRATESPPAAARAARVAWAPPPAAPRQVGRAEGSAPVPAAGRAAPAASGGDPRPSAPPAESDGDGPVLVATSRDTPVLEAPRPGARRIGTLRSGAVVQRDPEPAGGAGCKGGYYAVRPEGFVCAGPGASLDPAHPLALAARRRAEREGALPYVYGRTTTAGAPLYARLPTPEEQARAEPALALRPRPPGASSYDGLPLDAVPEFLEGGAPSLTPGGRRRSTRDALLGQALPRSGLAFLSLFEWGGRRFGLTTNFEIAPLDQVPRVEASAFHGLPLPEGVGLPVVFVRGRHAALHSIDESTRVVTTLRALEHRAAVPITGRRVTVGDRTYLEARGGGFVRDGNLHRVDAPAALPRWAEEGRAWIDVSIDGQSLVAYQGARPVFVTLVSTGKDGKGDPLTTHSTVQGEFRIHTKHVTATMDSDAVDDAYDLRDVPYVQYFKDGYALHAAYWHDGFGAPRSHGCVNLSPLDARWLFAFSEPHVPRGWHGAESDRGTLLRVRP